MLLREDSYLSSFDEHRWLINTATGHNLLVNKATAKLFTLLQNAGPLEQAYTQFNTDFQSNLSVSAFSELIHNRFGGYGILAYDKSDDKLVAGSSYIKLQFELLSAKVVAVCAAPLHSFYAPRIFWPIFGILLSFLLAVYKTHSGDELSAESNNYLFTIGCIYLSFLIHELGHIAACKQFNIRHGGVGFGFYMYVFPALYADVTNIWQADRQRRIIVNLGGIFSQTLYASLLAVAYLISSFQPLLLAVTGVMALALWQFNPFVRHDGYWLLSDVFHTPNLQAKAMQLVRHGLSFHRFGLVIRSRGRVLVDKRVFLFLYGLANSSLFLLFAVYTIARHGEELIKFPLLMTTLINKGLHGSLNLFDLKQIPLIAASFYVLSLRYLFVTLKRWWKQLK